MTIKHVGPRFKKGEIQILWREKTNSVCIECRGSVTPEQIKRAIEESGDPDQAICDTCKMAEAGYKEDFADGWQEDYSAESWI